MGELSNGCSYEMKFDKKSWHLFCHVQLSSLVDKKSANIYQYFPSNLFIIKSIAFKRMWCFFEKKNLILKFTIYNYIYLSLRYCDGRDKKNVDIHEIGNYLINNISYIRKRINYIIWVYTWPIFIFI